MGERGNWRLRGTPLRGRLPGKSFVGEREMGAHKGRPYGGGGAQISQWERGARAPARDAPAGASAGQIPRGGEGNGRPQGTPLRGRGRANLSWGRGQRAPARGAPAGAGSADRAEQGRRGPLRSGGRGAATVQPRCDLMRPKSGQNAAKMRPVCDLMRPLCTGGSALSASSIGIFPTGGCSRPYGGIPLPGPRFGPSPCLAQAQGCPSPTPWGRGEPAPPPPPLHRYCSSHVVRGGGTIPHSSPRPCAGRGGGAPRQRGWRRKLRRAPRRRQPAMLAQRRASATASPTPAFDEPA